MFNEILKFILLDYKALLKRILLLISSPAKAWEEIRVEYGSRDFLGNFVYPLIGIASLSVFMGSIFDTGWGEPKAFQIAMTNCCSVAVSLFGGFFFTAFIMNKIFEKFLAMKDNLLLLQTFTGYAMVVAFLIQIVLGLFPDFRIIGWIVQFYVLFIVWEGTPLLGVEEKDRLRVTLVGSIILIFCPAIISLVFNKLIYFLN